MEGDSGRLGGVVNLPSWLKQGWREAAIWALAAAFILELILNVFASETVWHRLTALEHSVQQLQHDMEKIEERVKGSH